MKKQRWGESEKRRENKRREEKKEKRREEKESEETRSRCAKRQKSREILCFSNVLWLRRVEKKARQSGGCGAIWVDERLKNARRCGAKQIWKSTCENTSGSERFWKFRCGKSTRRCGMLWREAHVEVKMVKAPRVQTNLWKLRCSKSARRCGAKHVSKSKHSKHLSFGTLLDVEILQKCRPL